MIRQRKGLLVGKWLDAWRDRWLCPGCGYGNHEETELCACGRGLRPSMEAYPCEQTSI